MLEARTVVARRSALLDHPVDPVDLLKSAARGESSGGEDGWTGDCFGLDFGFVLDSLIGLGALALFFHW